MKLSIPSLAVLACALALSPNLATAAAGSREDRPLKVEVTGKGKPVLLIPGLSCTGEVWKGTVNRLSKRYECHVFTLPGFGKQPPTQGPFLSTVRDEIVKYVKDKRLDHPAVIGHSLGGFMAFYLGSSEPKRFGPLVAVDGVPWLSALGNDKVTIETVKPQADAMKKAMAEVSNEQFRQGNRASLRAQINDEKKADEVFATSGESDQATVAQAMYEMLVFDLRPEVKKIESPVLLLAAGDWAKKPEDRATVERQYGAQIATIKNAKLVTFWDARHFIMLDDPDRFYKTVETFLGKSWPKR